MVHRQPPLDQWMVQLSMFLGVAEKDIGRIGRGKPAAWTWQLDGRGSGRHDADGRVVARKTLSLLVRNQKLRYA